MPYVNVDVFVSFDDFSTQELVKELEKRNNTRHTPTELEIIDRIYYAFYFGKTEEAMTLTKQMVQEATGRILPT
ncbi:hypothetical protein [Burkholderia glumae]|uniref:hypothetical protein n=1 Tax=Burkholderia glumae TaxID=337 RepID=UPI0021515DB0|nr:hypothetical protein [Burkholderia glumae]